MIIILFMFQLFLRKFGLKRVIMCPHKTGTNIVDLYVCLILPKKDVHFFKMKFRKKRFVKNLKKKYETTYFFLRTTEIKKYEFMYLSKFYDMLSPQETL